VHVPYRGVAPALTDLLGGQIQVVFTNLALLIGYIATGKLRALAITTATRWDALPDISTIGEFVPGYEASSVFGLGAPRNAPAEIIDRLKKEINAALADSGFKARLTHLNGTALGGSPADFGKLIADETEKWRKVIRLVQYQAGMRLTATYCAVLERVHVQPLNAAGRTYEVERRADHAVRSGFRIVEMQIGPTQRVPWHYHTEAQDTFYVINGTIRVFTREPEEEVCLTVGETYSVRPGRPHPCR
jgi:quercetin dioxygenase-like cupin family protein